MWLALAITVPFFYIIGLVTFLRWLGRNGHSAKNNTKSYVADELRLRADGYKGKVKSELLAVADALELDAPFNPATLESDTSLATGSFITDKLGPDGEVKTGHGKAEVSLANRDITEVLADMDNINLLLFLGAFLIVVSAGIFVGYNFQTLTGFAKVAFLFLFTAAFYLTGLILYMGFPKLRPAGSTFTGIGLVLMPFVGVAAYNFTGAHAQGSFVWLLTSIVCFLLYGVTLITTRQTYIAYLMAATTLSLFESAVSLISLPVYWFGWAGATVAILLMSLSWTRRLWKDAAFALTATAHVFIPISLLFSLWLAGDQGLGQFGITVALAGFFYLMLMFREKDRAMADHYFAAAAFALPIAVGTGLWDSFPRYTIVGLMMVVAVCYILAVAKFEDALTPYPKSTRRMTLAILAGGLPLAAIPMDTDSARVLTASLVGAVVLNGALAAILRQETYALIAELASLFLPITLFQYLIHPHLTSGQMAAVYLVLALILLGWRHTMRRWEPAKSLVGIAGYLLALISAFIAAAMSGHGTLIVVGLIAAAVLFALSYYEQAAEYFYLGAASLYLVAIQIVALSHWYDGAYAIALAIVGVVLYAGGTAAADDPRRAQVLVNSGLLGPYAAAVIGLTGTMGNAPAGALAIGGLLTFIEGYRHNNTQFMELAVAVGLIAADWLMINKSLSQTQYYSLPWAAYFGVLAWRRRKDASSRDIFVLIALAALTFPIANQALDAGGQWYGLELILVGLVVAIVGSTIKYRLMMWWGVATLVAEVLYQMRGVLFALPKYAISAILGLALLTAAIVMLQRRRQE